MQRTYRRLFIIFASQILFSCGQRQDTSAESSVRQENSLTDTSAKTIDTPSNVSYNCDYDNKVSSLGIGLVIAPSKFDIYNDSLLTDRSASWDMYEDEGKINLCSKFYKPDYGIMHFVCIGKTNKSYKVLVGNSDIKYFPNTKGYDFKTWGDYILESSGIRRTTEETSTRLPLRIEPNDNADTLTIPNGHEMFCQIEIKGDWVKVKYDCLYDDENNPNEGESCHNYIDKCKTPLTGWLRWRQDNELLIDIFLMP